jgi:hypothetical protein
MPRRAMAATADAAMKRSAPTTMSAELFFF